MASETKFIREVFARHGARPDLRLFRNPSAKVWAGKFVLKAKGFQDFRLQPGDVVLRGGQQMTVGLAEGAADLIGLQAVPVDELSLSSVVAQFVSLELKTEGVVTEPHQQKWMDMVQRLGGLAGVCRNMDEVDRLLGPRP